MNKPLPTLQIFPQHSWHMEAVIEGNTEGLKELARAILEAVNGRDATTKTVFPDDGEGYEVIIKRRELLSELSEQYYTFNVECHYPEHNKTRK